MSIFIPKKSVDYENSENLAAFSTFAKAKNFVENYIGSEYEVRSNYNYDEKTHLWRDNSRSCEITIEVMKIDENFLNEKD